MMVRQISILTKALLCNFLNLNVFRYTKDKKKKRNTISMALLWLMLIAMAFCYVGGITIGYIKLGMADVVPMYLVTVSALIILFFGMLKAGSIIFQKNSYEVLCSLPVSQTAIVVSRFLSMYVGNLLLSLVVMVPGMVVYAIFIHPGIAFYAFGILGTIFLPLFPMTVATLIGAFITAISTRMKHKSVVVALLSIIFVVAIMVSSLAMGNIEGDLTTEMLRNFSGILVSMIEKIYPPAVWLGTAMTEGKVLQLSLYLVVSIVVFLVMVILVANNFHKICQGLYSTSAKHNYQLTELKKTSALGSLYQKELKRYLVSSIYVINTIIGPIMMVWIAVGIAIVGVEKIEAIFPINIIGVVPFALAAVACIMTTTATSISMEGKEWWIIQSLPIKTKTVFDSKILLNLTLIAPFYVIAEIISILVLQPSLIELCWLILLPIIFIVFACVFGITINIRFPMMKWENETVVVKQSAAAMIGGLGGSLVILLCAVPVIFVDGFLGELVKMGITILILVITLLLYTQNNKVNLSTIE
ncbi:MAG: hypothetical protein IJO97_08770 [Lachnospiraceae bacterium]|nr:hypothetical protein [Lachnospiraceae bacterium]